MTLPYYITNQEKNPIRFPKVRFKYSEADQKWKTSRAGSALKCILVFF